MLNGLDLFSGIGGISLGLRKYVRTVAYCENDRYAQAVLMSRMADGTIDEAPIWDDVCTLRGTMLPSPIDIITGGFPCQDISIAQKDPDGLDGKRSGLFSKSSDSLAIFDPASFSWKTSQLSLFEDSTEFSWSSLRSGMIVDGRLYQPESLAPRTCAKDGGYLPTPCARDYRSPGASRSRKKKLEENRGIPLSQSFKYLFGGNLHPSFVEWMMGFAPKHTVLDAWAMQWFRSQLKKRSRDLAA